MVARQLAGRGIRDCRVLAAMAGVPREWFLPPHLASEAYEDAPLPIGSGQTISQSLIVALMTEALASRRRDCVLGIGTGCGSQSLCSRQADHAGIGERRAGGLRFVPIISRLALTEKPWT